MKKEMTPQKKPKDIIIELFEQRKKTVFNLYRLEAEQFSEKVLKTIYKIIPAAEFKPTWNVFNITFNFNKDKIKCCNTFGLTDEDIEYNNDKLLYEIPVSVDAYYIFCEELFEDFVDKIGGYFEGCEVSRKSDGALDCDDLSFFTVAFSLK